MACGLNALKKILNENQNVVSTKGLLRTMYKLNVSLQN